MSKTLVKQALELCKDDDEIDMRHSKKGNICIKTHQAFEKVISLQFKIFRLVQKDEKITKVERG